MVLNMQQRLTQIGVSAKENKELTKLLVKDTDENLNEVITRLEMMQLTQGEKKQKKWIIAAIGFVAFGVAAYFLSIVIYNIAKPTFDRT